MAPLTPSLRVRPARQCWWLPRGYNEGTATVKDPKPINLMTPEEAQALGWAGEARDADGHLISTTAPDRSPMNLGEWVLEWVSEGCTVTMYGRN